MLRNGAKQWPVPAAGAARGESAGGTGSDSETESKWLEIDTTGGGEPKNKKRKTGEVRGLHFEVGSHGIVSGASGRGKTVWMVKQILDKRSPWDAVLVMCDNVSIHQPKFKELASKFKKRGPVEFYEGLPQDDAEEEEVLAVLKEWQEEGRHPIVVLDDQMKASSTGFPMRFVDKLFTSARHLGATVFELNQAHTANRTRRLNAGVLACFATPTDVRALAHVARSMHPEDNGRRIMQAYREATESDDGHGCLLIFLHAPREFMFRNTSPDVCFDLESPSLPPVVGWTAHPPDDRSE